MTIQAILRVRQSEEHAYALARALKQQTIDVDDVVFFTEGIDPDGRKMQNVRKVEVPEQSLENEWMTWNRMIAEGASGAEGGADLVLFGEDRLTFRSRMLETIGDRLGGVGSFASATIAPPGITTPRRAPYTSVRRKPFPRGFIKSGWTKKDLFLASPFFFEAVDGIGEPPAIRKVQPEDYVEMVISRALDRADDPQLFDATPLVRVIEREDLDKHETSSVDARDTEQPDEDAEDASE